jgi:hypothetical protein
MAFNQRELQKYEKLVGAFVEKRRPREEIRDKVDIGYRISGQSVEIFEIRPALLDPETIIESPVAKATYVRTLDTWKVYWQMSDLKWHGYLPELEVKSLRRFLSLVDEDRWCCFWG